jgi:nucleotide-binding universal stress UspA family protein
MEEKMIPKIKKILYATDLSKNSAYVFRYAINTATKHNAKIHILHVIESISKRVEAAMLLHVEKKNIDQWKSDLEENLHRQIEERLKKFAEKELIDDQAAMKRIIGIHVVHGDPASEILIKADELGCDTVIMGTHSKGTIRYTFLGSVAEKVLRRIRKPVYIIPLPDHDLDITLGEI